VGRRLPVRGRRHLSPAPRPRSLFWTFAGTFLIVLLAATALEGVIVVTVLRPLADQRRREQADLAADRAARAIAALYDPYDLRELGRVLRMNRPPDSGTFLVFSSWDGRLVEEPTIGEDLRVQLVPMLRVAGLAPVPADSVRKWALGDSEVAASAARESSLEILAHHGVTIENSRFGEVVALGPKRASLWAMPEGRTLALFLPFAVLASGIAGLLMVRILVARLRALEHVAARVTEGELSARIETSGHDEIGQIEERINQMTDRLARARGQLESTDAQRRRLFADITHELATPLTSIRGYVETLLDPAVPKTSEERATFLNDVLEESKRLDAMLTELMELTRLEARVAPLARERLDWAVLCRNSVRRWGPRFAAAGLTLTWEGLEEGAWVNGDGRRLEQVIDNLLANGLRYVPGGGTVWVGMDSTAGAGGWRLTVSDDGPGIAAEDLPHVFERFYRAEAVRSRGGTGLGLAIVREIVTQHGGSVRAEGRAPRGASFLVELR